MIILFVLFGLSITCIACCVLFVKLIQEHKQYDPDRNFFKNAISFFLNIPVPVYLIGGFLILFFAWLISLP